MKDITFEKKDYPAIKETIYHTRLLNDFEVFVLPKEDFHEVYGVLTVPFGSVDTRFTRKDGREKNFPEGIAHFLEHKLFERADGSDLLESFTGVGAESNAFTGFTSTSYLFSTVEHTWECLDYLLELVQEAHFTNESVEREKAIIQQEIEMYRDDADSRLFYETLASLYPQTPLAVDIAGSSQSIVDIRTSDLQENFDHFYKRNQKRLFLIGNIDVEMVGTFFSKKMDTDGFFEKSKQKSVEGAPVALYPVVSNTSLRMEVTYPKLAVGIRGKQQVAAKDVYRYTILLRLLFSMLFGWTSKKHQKWYDEGKIEGDLAVEVEVDSRFWFVMVLLDTKEPVALSHQIRKAIRLFLTDEDISEAHFDSVKSEMFGDLFHGLNSLEFMATNFQPIAGGETIFDVPKILQETNLEDVLEVGRLFVEDSDMVDFTIFPI